MLRGDQGQEETTNVVKAMPVGTEGPKGMKEGESKFLGAREQKYTQSFATGEGNNVAGHSFTGLSKKWGNFCRKIDGFHQCRWPLPYWKWCNRRRILGVRSCNVYNIGESSVWEELVDEVRVSGEVMMDVKRRDSVRLGFNELIHMVPTGKG